MSEDDTNRYDRPSSKTKHDDLVLSDFLLQQQQQQKFMMNNKNYSNHKTDLKTLIMSRRTISNQMNGQKSKEVVDRDPNRTSSIEESKLRIQILLFPIAILFCALLINYIIFYHTKIFDGTSSGEYESLIKPEDYQDLSKGVTANNNNCDYDPRLMIQFTDSILQSNLDDFTTVENFPINLTDLSRFNNIHFGPKISSLVGLDPFKFVKFNLQRPCLLYTETFSCTKIGCNIKFCNRDELPKAYLVLDNSTDDCPTDSPKALSKLDQTLNQTNMNELNRLFECSRDDSEESQYYNLVLNPERYTGYDGSQIWKSIYEENCFSTKNLNNNLFTVLNNACSEQRLFYRIISGLHTSITIHLTSIHHKFKDHFGPNPKDYFKRFYGHSDYLKNLFFTYLIELSALYKSQSYLLNKIKWNSIEEKIQAKDAIKALLSTEKLFKWHFDENVLFQHETISEQLGHAFNNITFKIMDCVSCDKCRLWGKVQTNGLGTAFKIMLTKDLEKLTLSHHEITCLLNAVARLSYSINQISNFRDIFQQKLSTTNSDEGEGHSFEKNIKASDYFTYSR
ncbi:ERO1-like protein beta [Sarcoptes scabiei]|uniref:ERO1-like protein beta n=1 Tax=Sarcoptes scabiei TaxID=52283 RepID=A0A834R543_SARSC|nr:ERO1-like protein beta [Sarcoptes scabiei]